MSANPGHHADLTGEIVVVAAHHGPGVSVVDEVPRIDGVAEEVVWHSRVLCQEKPYEG
ncbi:hypothetical protein ACWC3X_09125 [Streptomyces populi]